MGNLNDIRNNSAAENKSTDAWITSDYFREVLQHAPALFAILTGPDMIISFVNAPLLLIWGKNDTIIGKPYLQALPEMKNQPFPSLLQEVFRSGRPYYGKEEKAVVQKNGKYEEQFFNYVYYPAFDAEGRITGITIIATEITEQVIARKKMEEREKQLREFIRTSSDVIYRMSADWTVMEELEGRGFLPDTAAAETGWVDIYIHPDDQQRVNDAIKKAIREKTVYELEHRVLQNDGEVGWTYSRAVPMFDKEGNITEWFGTATDITSRKKAELALEANKRLYDAVTNTTPDLIYVFSLDYKFIYANKALLTMWGRTEEESIGRRLIELGYEPWHAEMHEREIDHVVATKESIRGEVSFPHAIQGKRIYDYIFTPVLDENGEVEAIAGTTRDITEIKAAEMVLEKLVQDRTRELQRSNADLLKFAHVASHDLKEPVRKVKTFISRLERDPETVLSPKAQEYIAKVYSSTERMYKMIEGVLTYSTITHADDTYAEIDISEIIQTISNDLEVLIEQKSAVVECGYIQYGSFQGIPALIYQLFYNLINNSLKFARTDVPPRILIAAKRVTINVRPYLQIELKDNGIGFPQSHADKIFQTFTRLNSRDQYEGTGLGLALCKEIVERHQGTITASGEENKGATFTILLPIKY